MSKITIKEAVNSKSITFLNFYAQIKNAEFSEPDKTRFAEHMTAENENQPLATIFPSAITWLPKNIGFSIDTNLIFASPQDIDTSFSDLSIVAKNFRTIIKTMRANHIIKKAFQITKLSESQYKINLNNIDFIVPSEQQLLNLSTTNHNTSIIVNDILVLKLKH